MAFSSAASLLACLPAGRPTGLCCQICCCPPVATRCSPLKSLQKWRVIHIVRSEFVAVGEKRAARIDARAEARTHARASYPAFRDLLHTLGRQTQTLDSASIPSGLLCHEFAVPEDGGVEGCLFLTLLSPHKHTHTDTQTHSYTHTHIHTPVLQRSERPGQIYALTCSRVPAKRGIIVTDRGLHRPPKPADGGTLVERN